MNKARQSLVIDRGLALHKLIRLLTFFVGGEGWLNFMGNEFGHPEWVDFPRQGNDFSYKYARRQWSLADNPDLHYEQLARFDLALQQLDEQHHLLTSPRARLMQCDELGKRIVAERANLILAVNLHPAMSFTDWRIGVPGSPSTPTAAFTSILDTDAQPFGGHALVTPGHTYPAQAQPWDEMKQSVQIYVPARSGQIVAARK
jgi:1,4-alpha-glucan branching enzyme